ncbi:hypothetical protein CBF68_02155 [Lactobacillus taiwanensis]|uniref:hypothetical protein n=1 Tax=Lactobacillus taiwanensis TaxID=508451 RepID=UPI000B9811A7|nr:hypothetical protein [Lactobacillus taiwanensis]OYS00627.1 hypothetical protein CBF64_01245 [Lactobacillus taiwanensis]OYS04675.1 hypothetical protein CBF68_02155 [Lactobacillus taiwanensis]
MLLQLNPEAKIISKSDHFCTVELNNTKMLLHGDKYEKFFSSLIRNIKKPLVLSELLSKEALDSKDIQDFKDMIRKLLQKKILIFAGYEKVKSRQSLKILIINFSQDIINKDTVSNFFSKDDIAYINSDYCAVECDRLKNFRNIFKKIRSSEYDVICPVLWHLCPYLLRDISEYTKKIVPIISNSNYFSYGPLITPNNCEDSLLSLSTEENRYRYIDYHYSRQVNLFPYMFLANEINQWDIDEAKKLCNCNIFETICSYNYNSQVFKKGHIIWVREDENER